MHLEAFSCGRGGMGAGVVAGGGARGGEGWKRSSMSGGGQASEGGRPAAS
jgi:hypothetical protein